MLYAISTEMARAADHRGTAERAVNAGQARDHDEALLIGSMSIDGKVVPCYLARGLANRSGSWMPRSSCACDPERAPASCSGEGSRLKCHAANVIMTLPPATDGSAGFARLDKGYVETFFRSNLGLALGGTALTLVENADGESGTLHVRESRSCLCSANSRSTVSGCWWTQKKKGLPGVKTRDLIAGSKSSGIQQMLGKKAVAGLPRLHRRPWPVLVGAEDQLIADRTRPNAHR